jgi:hypothetical protein
VVFDPALRTAENMCTARTVPTYPRGEIFGIAGLQLILRQPRAQWFPGKPFNWIDEAHELAW